MIHSVTLEFEQTEKNGRTFSKLKGGVIELSNAVIRDESLISILYSQKSTRIPVADLIVV